MAKLGSGIHTRTTSEAALPCQAKLVSADFLSEFYSIFDQSPLDKLVIRDSLVPSSTTRLCFSYFLKFIVIRDATLIYRLSGLDARFSGSIQANASLRILRRMLPDCMSQPLQCAICMTKVAVGKCSCPIRYWLEHMCRCLIQPSGGGRTRQHIKSEKLLHLEILCTQLLFAFSFALLQILCLWDHFINFSRNRESD